MKKIFSKIWLILTVAVLISLCLNVISFAEELAEPSGGVTEGSEAQTSDTGTVSSSEDGFGAFLELVETVVGADFLNVASMGINIALLVLMAILKKNSKVNLSDILHSVSARDSNGEKISLAEVIKRLNDSANQNAEELSEFKHLIAEELKRLCETYSIQTVTHEQVAELTAATKAALNIFHTIYSQSKTITSGTKSQEEQYYTEAMNHIAALEAEDAKNDKQS